MRYIALAISGMAIQSCASRSSQSESSEPLNSSSLYDPPSITLIEGKAYQFEEGELVGTGQKFHSHFYYLRALIIGK